MSKELFGEGYERALELMHRAATPEGFVASTTETDNYRRVWARDGVIVSLAALMTDDEQLRQTALATLRTLMNHQGPHGEIPSNVDTGEGRVSYGGTAGRVDASLWFAIGVHQYWKRTSDERCLEEFRQSLQRVQFLLGAWEFNTKGLIYIPETGDWSDEYIQRGYVLYDQLLYWQTLTGLCEIHAGSDGAPDHVLRDKTGRVLELIRGNYWFENGCDPNETDVYHPVIYAKGCEEAKVTGAYWMPYFSPTGYGYRFDSLANALASLLGIASDDQNKAVDDYIDAEVVSSRINVLPAFWPPIREKDGEFAQLRTAFSYEFKNKPYAFHNGGLWPMVTGFYVAALAKRKEENRAREYLKGIHEANQKNTGGERWGFYEFLNGKTLRVGGTQYQAWSAAAAVMGHLALEGEEVLI